MKSLYGLILSLLLAHSQCAAQVFATIDSLSGTATITAADGTTAAAASGQKISRGQTVVTAADSELHAVTEDGGFIALRPNTTFLVSQYRMERDGTAGVEMSLLKGALRSITGWIGKVNPGGYRVVTPTATVGIRGTDHETTVVEADGGRDRAGTFDHVLEGATTLRSAAGEQHLEAGQHGFAPRDGNLPPRLLDAAPDFLSNRQLRIEERIRERKEFVARRVQQLTEERPARAAAIAERIGNASDDRREAVKKQIQRKLQQRKVN